MPQVSLSTEPDLNFGPLPGRVDPDAPRVRVRGGPVAKQRVLVRRDGSEVVRYSDGLVELVGLPDFDFDFRVRFELVEGEVGPVLAPAAVAVIARAGSVGAYRPGDFTEAGIARAIKTAGRALTRRQEVDDSGRPKTDRGASAADITRLLPAEEVQSRFRESSRVVEGEARAVAAEWWKLSVDGVVPTGYAGRIGGALGWGTDKDAQERVRKRMGKATRMGLVPPAGMQRSKQRR